MILLQIIMDSTQSNDINDEQTDPPSNENRKYYCCVLLLLLFFVMILATLLLIANQIRPNLREYYRQLYSGPLQSQGPLEIVLLIIVLFIILFVIFGAIIYLANYMTERANKIMKLAKEIKRRRRQHKDWKRTEFFVWWTINSSPFNKKNSFSSWQRFFFQTFRQGSRLFLKVGGAKIWQKVEKFWQKVLSFDFLIKIK